MDKNIKIFIIAIVVLILGVIGLAMLNKGGSLGGDDGKYNEFAQCLNDKGAVFYGAFWCPHCQSQKKLFGSAEKLLNYVECSTPDGNAQVKQCLDKNITGYPTWEFADGSREGGEVALEKLAEKTGCVLPADESLMVE